MAYLSPDGVHLTRYIPPGKTHSGVFHHYMAVRRALIKGASLISCEFPYFLTLICAHLYLGELYSCGFCVFVILSLLGPVNAV